MSTIFERCTTLKEYASGKPEWRAAMSAVESAYTSEDRVYHDIRHLHRLFDELDRWRPELRLESDQMVALELAIAYHDVVYVPGSKENERKSAVRAVKDLRALGVPRHIIHLVKSAILATIRHVCGRHDRIASLLIDLDLCAMANANEYTENGKRIREEFSIFDDREYAAGRISFLGEMVKRRRIFRSPFAKRYESSARQNILADLERQQAQL